MKMKYRRWHAASKRNVNDIATLTDTSKAGTYRLIPSSRESEYSNNIHVRTMLIALSGN